MRRLGLRWAWWTPDAGHPYDCAPAERFSRERGWPREIMQLFARLNAAGTTIVQVTHSEENAAYGRRTIHLRDGWMEA